MKPTSPLSLVLFLNLHLVHSAPTSFPPDCAELDCSSALLALLATHDKPNTPPTHLRTVEIVHPAAPADDIEIDNSAYTPSARTPASDALSTHRPLESNYLMSLSKPAAQETRQYIPLQNLPHQADARPAKPTSALPDRRKGDSRRYWASLHNEQGGDVQGGAAVAGSPAGESAYWEVDHLPGSVFYTSRESFMKRNYSDYIVVGMVLLFLIAVIGMELLEKIGSVTGFCSRANTSQLRRGQIFLADDETVAFIVKAPISISADDATWNEKEGQMNESDASERV